MITEEQQTVEERTETVELVIYVAQHCEVCRYAHEVAADIQARYPSVDLRMVDMATTTEAIPESVFATPTYLLNGRVWSLGNPSQTMVTETFNELVHSE